MPRLGNALGSRIGLLRQQAGLTQQGLADALGVSRSLVAQWESGRGGELRYIGQVAAVLNVPEEAFLNGMAVATRTETLSIDELRLLDLYRHLSTTDRIAALAFVAERTARPGDRRDVADVHHPIATRTCRINDDTT